MPRNTYLYGNRMLTNKVWGEKEKERVTLIKSLFNVIFEETLEGHTIKYLKGIGLKERKVKADVCGTELIL